MASITFFVFLTLALSFTTIHARESQFFAKVSNNIPQESQPLNTNEKDLKFVPQTRETTQASGYGLFGHESGQLPPSAAPTNNNNEKKYYNNNYPPTNQPENYNPVAYTTPIHSSTQDIPNEFRYEPQAYKGDNNNMYNSQNQEQLTNDDNLFNSQNQDEFMQTNDANMYNSNKQEMGTNGGNMYNNNYEKQGMSDTRFLDNGNYYYDLNLENQNMNSRGVRNGFETQGYYANNDNSYDRYNTNVNGRHQNQEFQVNQDDRFNP